MTVSASGNRDQQGESKSRRLLGALAALGAVLIWGFTFVPSKLALAEMGPFTLAVLRFLLALMVILPAIRLLPPSARVRRVPWRVLALAGLTGVTLYFGFQNVGLALTSAAEAGLIAGAVPALTAAGSALVLHERMTRSRLLGISASVVGVAIVVLAGNAARGGGSLVGDLLIMGAMIAWVFYTLVNKSVSGRMPDGVLLAYTMTLGTLFMLPTIPVELSMVGFGPVSVGGWLSVLFLGVGGSAAAFYCWNTALHYLDASEASTYINLVPVVTVLSAALMLGERPAPGQLVGGALVMLGVYLAGRNGGPREWTGRE